MEKIFVVTLRRLPACILNVTYFIILKFFLFQSNSLLTSAERSVEYGLRILEGYVS
jgi:hypothetical protein